MCGPSLNDPFVLAFNPNEVLVESWLFFFLKYKNLYATIRLQCTFGVGMEVYTARPFYIGSSRPNLSWHALWNVSTITYNGKEKEKETQNKTNVSNT